MIESTGSGTEGSSENVARTKYLRKKGVMELLLELREAPKRFSDLKELVDVSSATLTSRLEEGVKLGMLEEEIQYIEREERREKRKVYKLTDEYEWLGEWLGRRDLDELVAERAALQDRIESKYTAFLDRADEKLTDVDKTI
ncbi:hypothetical protein KY092_04505 [Natronomonas gomsonensis]|uniref:hypothetical protein n=1 Tax=Natronomonas gomsonensis TaxID=1046043 RepID=UPI0020CA4B67|nr:hypothetical protein [Natronomonas gomsonensis]MCY4729817.1 hypothetical protein [Natronomonas gomsonensis]